MLLMIHLCIPINLDQKNSPSISNTVHCQRIQFPAESNIPQWQSLNFNHNTVDLSKNDSRKVSTQLQKVAS